MKNNLFMYLCVSMPFISIAQSPISGFMKKKGEITGVVSYGTESYENVFLVPKEVDAVPVFNDVKINSISFYSEFGITDKINLVFTLPYIESFGNASQTTQDNLGVENKRVGIQNMKLFGKFLLTSFGKKNKLDVIGSLGFETPLGSYKADEGLQSILAIGNRATVFSPGAAVMYKNDMGIFASGQLAYNFKSIGIPDAISSEIKLGYAHKRFYVDAFLANQLSEKDGVDILNAGFMGNFPATRVNFTRVGLNGYVPFYKSFGLVAGANSYISGRNLGKSTGFYGGIVYNFKK